jgi:hypothetical protein
VRVVDDHAYPAAALLDDAGVQKALATASDTTTAELRAFAAGIRGIVVQAFKRA